MAYDAMDRLTYANIPGHGASTWAYDPLDNIRSVTTAPTAGTAYTRSYLYDDSNRLTSITQDGATWGVGTYDARGNLIDRNGMTLVFDRASRLTAIPGVANYEYDGHGRRTAQWRADGTVRVSLYTLDGRLQGEADNRAVGSTDYIYLGGTLVAKRFQHWSGIPPAVTYLHSDGLGSPVLETDATGAVLSRERFLSYGGAVDGAVKDAVGYTGHQEDPASGLVYMQQRYYDPVTGRFLSVDPMPSDMQNGWNFNRYNYAANNPYKFMDPDGRVLAFAPGSSQAFKDEIGKQLVALNQTEAGSGMIDQLQTSKNVFLFTENRGESKIIPENVDNSRNGEGSSAVIFHDQNATPDAMTERGKEPTPAHIVLGHELAHAVEIDKGKVIDLGPDTLPAGERRARIEETKIRLELNLPQRIIE
jgi:RHS repeat-associated protein